MLPQSSQTGGIEYLTAKIYSFTGMDRISSDLYLETEPNNLFYFPFISSSVLMGQNVVDDEAGALNKRPGSILYLDNPDGEPVQELIQFLNYQTNLIQQLRVSGNSIYRYTYSGSSWGSSIKTLEGSNIRMSHASLNGYIHLSNGVDPLMYYDGENFYEVVNGAVSTTLSQGLAPYLPTSSGTQDIYVNSITGFNPQGAFIQIGSAPVQEPVLTNEIIQYANTTTVSGSDCFQVTGSAFRSYNYTTPTTATYNAITSTQTTIQVDSVVQYPSTGYIQIDQEVIAYTGTTQAQSATAASFNNCTRGVQGTTAATHTSDTYVGIYWPAGTEVYVYYGSPPPQPRIVFALDNRLWAFNTNEAGGSSSIYVSQINNNLTDAFNWMLSYQSTSVLNNGALQFTGSLAPNSSFKTFLDPQNGQEISAVNTVQGSLIVAKQQSLYTIQMTTNGSSATGVPQSIQKTSSQYGTQSIHGLVSLDSNVFMLNGYGILSTNSGNPLLQSYNITDLVQGIDSSNLTSIYGCKHNFKLFYSIGSTTEAPWIGNETYDNAVLVYNYLTSHWWLYTYPFTINCFSEMYDTANITEELTLYYGDTNGNTYYTEGQLQTNNVVYNDAGIDIPIKIRFRYFFFKDPATWKEFRDTTVICENGENASLYTSFITDDAVSGYNFAMPLPKLVNRRKFPDQQRETRGISYMIVESSSSRFRLKGIEQEYEATY
jgi:hypothetical protein